MNLNLLHHVMLLGFNPNTLSIFFVHCTFWWSVCYSALALTFELLLETFYKGFWIHI